MDRKVLLAAAVMLLGSYAHAKTELKFTNTINLAGRQRMLTQKMAKECLLVKIGVAKEDAMQDLNATITLFDSTLNGLIAGDAKQDMLAPPSDDVRRQLEQVRNIWTEYKGVLTNTAAPATSVSSLSETILVEMDKAVKMYEKAYQEITGNPVGALINTAGRQRMLSQKAAKHFYLVLLNADKEGNMQKLNATESLFEKSHRDLVQGNAELGLPPTTHPEVSAQMDKVQGVWEQYKAAIRSGKSKAGAETSKQVFDLSKSLLKEMNSAVSMYVFYQDQGVPRQ